MPFGGMPLPRREQHRQLRPPLGDQVGQLLPAHPGHLHIAHHQPDDRAQCREQLLRLLAVAGGHHAEARVRQHARRVAAGRLVIVHEEENAFTGPLGRGIHRKPHAPRVRVPGWIGAGVAKGDAPASGARTCRASGHLRFHRIGLLRHHLPSKRSPTYARIDGS